MKTIFLILITYFTLNAQGFTTLGLLMGDGGFDPVKYDATNLVALYDGDVGLATDAWADQSGNGHTMTLANSPTINSASLNGHNTVTFNGTDEYGTNGDAILTSQPYTIYFVFKQVTWTANDRFFNAKGVNSAYINQSSSSPNLQMTAGTGIVKDNFTVGTFFIATTVWNGTSSLFRRNDDVTATANANTNTGTGGFFLCSNYVPNAFYANCEVAYIIIRNGADDTDTQDLFISFLKDRFGL